MKERVCVKPQIVADVDSLEWTGAGHLRHTNFVGLRYDVDPRKPILET
jgi:ATP-dependent DNA ligase